jgi:hypothetical protein
VGGRHTGKAFTVCRPPTRVRVAAGQQPFVLVIVCTASRLKTWPWTTESTTLPSAICS